MDMDINLEKQNDRVVINMNIGVADLLKGILGDYINSGNLRTMCNQLHDTGVYALAKDSSDLITYIYENI